MGTRNLCIVGLLASGTLFGCGSANSEESRDSNDNLASVELALTSSVPSGVQCIKVTVNVAGQTVNPAPITVSTGSQATNLSLGQLPAGAATFQASAYNIACASVTSSTTANWVADTATATLVPGYVSSISLNFKQNNNVTVSANFAGNVAEVSTSYNCSFARMGDGTVMQWGNVASATPSPVPSLTNVAQVVGGNSFGCARKTDGTAWCWGYNFDKGNLGPNAPLSAWTSTPVQVPGLYNVTALAAGNNHVCAVSGWLLYCWGNNAEGEFGNGTTTSSATPVLVKGYVTAVSAGMYHTCTSDSTYGYVSCTGSNSYGQLGNNSSTSSTSYVSTGLGGATALSGGYYHTCAISGDNLARCWGGNFSGMLGDGTTTNRLVPTLVPGLSSVQQIQTGQSHTCALTQNGTVSCWGEGVFVGTGQLTNQLTPVSVLTNAIAVHVSNGAHSCVELADHSVKCWGGNMTGQVGDGSYKYTPRPSLIAF